MLRNSYYYEIHTATKQTTPGFFKDIEMEILEKSLIMLSVDEYSNYETQTLFWRSTVGLSNSMHRTISLVDQAL